MEMAGTISFKSTGILTNLVWIWMILHSVNSQTIVDVECRDDATAEPEDTSCQYTEGKIAYFDVLIEPEVASPEYGVFYTESFLPEGASTSVTDLATPGFDYVPIVVEVYDEWDYLQVEILDDCDAEDEEAFTALLRDDTDRTTTMYEDFVIATIVSDDDNYYLEKEHYEVDEDAGSVEFSVCRIGAKNDNPDKLTFSTCDMTATSDDDFTGVSPGNPESINFEVTDTCQEARITIHEDNEIEGPEVFGINIQYDGTTADGKGCTGKVIEPSKGFVTINDASSCIAFESSIYTVKESAGTVDICLRREGSNKLSQSIDVTITDVDATDGTDYKIATPSVNFNAGSSRACFDLVLENDLLKEGSECFWMALQVTVGVDVCSQEEAQVMIKDDDDEFYIEGNKYKVKESDTNFEVTIVRSGYLGSPSTICVSTQSGIDPTCDAQPTSDYTQINADSVTFAVNQKSQTVPITIVNDNIAEDDEEFYLVLDICPGPDSSADEELRFGYPRKTSIWIKNTFACITSCENGECVAENTCECVPEYTGALCDIPVCDPNCVNGDCIEGNICRCDVGWTGDACDTPDCTPSCINGECARVNGINRCECPRGWSGNRCNIGVAVVTSSFTAIELPRGVPLIYHPDLNNPMSARFIELKNLVEAVLEPVFDDIDGYRGMAVIAFEQGSVRIIYELELENSNGLSVSEINQMVSQVVQPDGELSNSGLILEPTDPLVARCPLNYCYNGGYCVESLGGYSCVCIDGYTGAQCLIPPEVDDDDNEAETSVSPSGLSDGALAGIIVGSVLGLLLLLLLGLVGFCLVLRGRKQVPQIDPAQQQQVQLYPYDGGVYGLNGAMQGAGMF